MSYILDFSSTSDNPVPLMELSNPQELNERMLARAYAMVAEAERLIAKQRERIKTLESLSFTDELTGLVNRRAFEMALSRELAAVSRDPSQTGTVIMVDLDSFKQINDRFGHAGGDAASIIPLALLGTFIGLTFAGIPANLLSLGAMDFGIIVDGAVIVIENIFRRLGEAAKDDDHRPRVRTIQEAVIEVGRPTVFSMVIIIVAHLPIFTMQRHEGKIFAPMAYSVVAALITSLILSLTLVPFLSKIAFRNHVPHEETKLMHWLHNAYQPQLGWALANTRKVLGAALLALAITAACVPQLGTEFLPELNEGSIWLNITLPTSVSVDEARGELRKLRRTIADFPEVNAVVSKGGRPEDGTDPKNINMTEMLVDLKPESAWRKGMTKEQLVRVVEDKLNDMPGIEPTFSQPVRDQILESISQIDGQIVIKLFGDDMETLRAEGRQVLERIGKVPPAPPTRSARPAPPSATAWCARRAPRPTPAPPARWAPRSSSATAA